MISPLYRAAFRRNRMEYLHHTRYLCTEDWQRKHQGCITYPRESLQIRTWQLAGEWFLPTLDAIRIKAISWETLISSIESNDPEVFQSLKMVYERCLIYNWPGVQLVSDYQVQMEPYPVFQTSVFPVCCTNNWTQLELRPNVGMCLARRVMLDFVDYSLSLRSDGSKPLGRYKLWKECIKPNESILAYPTPLLTN